MPCSIHSIVPLSLSQAVIVPVAAPRQNGFRHHCLLRGVYLADNARKVPCTSHPQVVAAVVEMMERLGHYRLNLVWICWREKQYDGIGRILVAQTRHHNTLSVYQSSMLPLWVH